MADAEQGELCCNCGPCKCLPKNPERPGVEKKCKIPQFIDDYVLIPEGTGMDLVPDDNIPHQPQKVVTTCIARWPCAFFLFMLLQIMMIAGAAAAFFEMADPSESDYFLKPHHATQKMDATELAHQHVAGSAGTVYPQSIEWEDWRLMVIYHDPDDIRRTISPQNMDRMRYIESRLKQHELYTTSCWSLETTCGAGNCGQCTEAECSKQEYPLDIDPNEPLDPTNPPVPEAACQWNADYTLPESAYGDPWKSWDKGFCFPKAPAGPTDGTLGCHEITDEASCVASTDGRNVEGYEYIFGSPCVWCCGASCTTMNANKCEPMTFLQHSPYDLAHEAAGGFHTGVDSDSTFNDTCTAKADAVAVAIAKEVEIATEAAIHSPVHCHPGAHISLTQKYPEGATQAEMDVITLGMGKDLYNPDKFANTGFYFDQDFKDGDTNALYIRTLFLFGRPTTDMEHAGEEPYVNQEDRDEDQTLSQTDLMTDWVDFAKNDGPTDTMDVHFSGGVAFNILFLELVAHDAMLIIFSFLWVFIAVTLATKSVFLGFFGFMQLWCGIGPGFMMYQSFVTYVGVLHVLALFVLLSVGSGNLFIFTDVWRLSKFEPQLHKAKWMHLRLAWTYDEVMKHITFPTVVSFFVFVCMMVSRIIPIAAFGFFSACLIVANFGMVSTIYPCGLIIRQKHEKRCCAAIFGRCFSSCRLTDEETRSKDHDTSDTFGQDQDKDMSVEARLLSQFFVKVWAPKLFRLRWIILTLLVPLIIATTATTRRISPLSTIELLFPESNFMGVSLGIVKGEYPPVDKDTVNIQMVWGVRGVDRSGTDKWDILDLGTVVWDPYFDLSPVAAQQFYMDTCNEVSVAYELVKEGLTECWSWDFADYLDAQYNGTFPYTYTEDPAYKDHTGGDPDGTVQYEGFTKMVTAFSKSSFNTETGSKRLGLDPTGVLRYTEVYAISKLPIEQTYEVTHPEFEKWEDYMSVLNTRAPTSMNKGYQSSTKWPPMFTEKEYHDGAFMGMRIALAVTFVLLCFHCKNIIVAVYATIGIYGVIMSCATVMWLKGWEMGVSESIGLVAIVGLACDFIAHICSAYVEAPALDGNRLYKTRRALHRVGATLVAGSVTGMVSGMIMAGCIIKFFSKFAVILVSTYSFVLLYSIIFLPAVLMAIGPEGAQGDLMFAVQWAQACYYANDENHFTRMRQDAKQKMLNEDGGAMPFTMPKGSVQMKEMKAIDESHEGDSYPPQNGDPVDVSDIAVAEPQADEE